MELIDYFGQGKGETALVGSTLMGTHLIFGKNCLSTVVMFVLVCLCETQHYYGYLFPW